MVWMENEYGGIRVYKFDVDRVQGRPASSVVFPDRAGRLHLSRARIPTAPARRTSRATPASRRSGTSSRHASAPRGTRPAAGERPSARATASPTTSIELQSLLNSNNVSPWAADIIHRTGTLDNPWQGLPGGNPFPFDWRTNAVLRAGLGVHPLRRRSRHDLRAVVERWRVQQQIVGPVAGVGELSRQQEQPAVEHDGGEPVIGPHAAVASQPLHRAGHLRARRRHLHAVQPTSEHQPAARAASLGGAEQSGAAARCEAVLEHRRVPVGQHGQLPRPADVGARRSRQREPQRQLHAVEVHERPHQRGCVQSESDVPRRHAIARACAADRRHIVQSDGRWPARREFDNATARALASDWRLSMVYRWASGAPLTITLGRRSRADRPRRAVRRSGQRRRLSGHVGKPELAVHQPGGLRDCRHSALTATAGFFSFDGFGRLGTRRGAVARLPAAGRSPHRGAHRGVQSDQLGDLRTTRAPTSPRPHSAGSRQCRIRASCSSP